MTIPKSDVEDELVQNMNGIDKTLVKMMRKIELQAYNALEKYQTLNFAHKHEHAFRRRRDYLNRYYEGIRKTRRAEEGKKREEKLQAEKREKQIKKQQEKEKIVKYPAKPLMLRSPQPAPRRIEKVVQMDREEMDMLRYLGTTLDPQEDG